MDQHHPLENPSLAPYDFVFPNRQKRQAFEPPDNQHWVNEEKLIAHLWDTVNRAKSKHPLPVKTIIHDLLPGFATRHRLTKGDFVFDGLPYLARDILVLSSTIQWFGTNCGRSFLENKLSSCEGMRNVCYGPSQPSDSIRWHPAREFIIKLMQEDERRGTWVPGDMAAFFVHECTPDCTSARQFFISHERCWYRWTDASERDRAVIHGLMYWLGTSAGRTFIALFGRKKKSAWDEAHRQRRLHYEKKRPSAA